MAIALAAITDQEYEAVTVATRMGTGADWIVSNVQENSEGKGREIYDSDEGLLTTLLLRVIMNKK